MFERKKAIKIYKSMLSDLLRTKRLLENTEDYDGFDRGFVIVPTKKVNEKLTNYLSAFATRDNYNFCTHDVQNINDGSMSVMCALDNESEEFKAKRRAEIENFVSTIKGIDKTDNCKVVRIDEGYFRRK